MNILRYIYIPNTDTVRSSLLTALSKYGITANTYYMISNNVWVFEVFLTDDMVGIIRGIIPVCIISDKPLDSVPFEATDSFRSQQGIQFAGAATRTLAGTSVLYTVPAGYIAYLNTLTLSGSNAGGGAGAAYIRAVTDIIASLCCGAIAIHMGNIALTFNGAIKLTAGQTFTFQTSTDAIDASAAITGWLEEA